MWSSVDKVAFFISIAIASIVMKLGGGLYDLPWVVVLSPVWVCVIVVTVLAIELKVVSWWKGGPAKEEQEEGYVDDEEDSEDGRYVAYWVAVKRTGPDVSVDCGGGIIEAEARREAYDQAMLMNKTGCPQSEGYTKHAAYVTRAVPIDVEATLACLRDAS
jgi:hypothetical protein